MTDDIVWEDPPEKKHTNYRAVADALIAHPGKWARVGKDVSFGKQMAWRTTMAAIDKEIKVSQRITSGKTGQTTSTYDVYACYRPEAK